MEETKIQFSPAEMELMCNAQVILTKNRVLYGIKQLLEGLEQRLAKEAYFLNEPSLTEYFNAPPKISRGENYLGLPYLVLDYPRHFDSVNILAIRTMFWWGHSFSSTLHLSGSLKELFTEKLEAFYFSLSKGNYYIGVNEDPWQHHFEEDNYLPINGMSEEAFGSYCREYDHLKLAKQFPLQEIESIEEDLLNSWRALINTLKH